MGQWGYAAIGTDGKDYVVWGIGKTAEKAHEDALHWLSKAGCAEEELELRCISSKQARAIEAGDCHWPPSPRPRRGHETL